MKLSHQHPQDSPTLVSRPGNGAHARVDDGSDRMAPGDGR